MKSSRIQSIDALRGLVMIIMALDHCRDFFHYDAFLHDPLNLLYSPAGLFLTRWITHFCAPTFIFLTGISAYLYGLKHTKKQLSRFLFARGLLLIFLEITFVAFGWFFRFHLTHPTLMVIWAIGISMVFLSAVIGLPYAYILIIGLAITLLHNLADGVRFTQGTLINDLWLLLHVQGQIHISTDLTISVFYPVLPYFGLICLGYAFGKLFSPETEPSVRKKALGWIGILCVLIFIALRYLNIYGDPHPWEQQEPVRYTVLSFINCNKYPVSLLFALMTIGPSILFLYFFDGVKNGFTKVLVTIGKVPMFYYIIHIYLIHTIAALTENAGPTPFGVVGRFHLWTVYLIWMGIVAALYMPCKWYGQYKSGHPEKWWLSYL